MLPFSLLDLLLLAAFATVLVAFAGWLGHLISAAPRERPARGRPALRIVSSQPEPEPQSNVIELSAAPTSRAQSG